MIHIQGNICMSVQDTKHTENCCKTISTVECQKGYHRIYYIIMLIVPSGVQQSICCLVTYQIDHKTMQYFFRTDTLCIRVSYLNYLYWVNAFWSILKEVYTGRQWWWRRITCLLWFKGCRHIFEIKYHPIYVNKLGYFNFKI